MRAGFVGLIGLPNAGKSTLVNALVGEKVGIVSKKPQTTRKRVIGLYNEPDAQVIFIDAPGLVKSASGLNQFLQRELEGVVRDSDVCLAVLNVDAQDLEQLLEVVEIVRRSGKPWAVVITKNDLDTTFKNGSRTLLLQNKLLEVGVPVVVCSARQPVQKLREKLLPVIRELLPESNEPLFADDIYTTQTSRELVAEIVREKCFEYLHQEVPYGLTVQILKYDESGPIPKIYVEIVVAKENFVSMVVGQGGQMIKRIGASSRIEVERVLGQKVFLQTHVKVKRDWNKNPETLKEFGYVTPL
jgi:GTPase